MHTSAATAPCRLSQGGNGLAEAAYQLGVQASFGSRSVLRAYVRDEERQFEVAALMQQRFPNASYCILAGEVCRSELLVELEAVHHF